MSKFDELKKEAEAAMSSASDFEYEQFQSVYGPAKFLELLAIQAQLVEALQACVSVRRFTPTGESNEARIKATAALAVAGAQP